MNLNKKDIVFRWVSDNEITICRHGHCLYAQDYVSISSRKLMELRDYYKPDFSNGIKIPVRITRATYNLRSSKGKRISIETYLNPGMGVGGQFSGWLEFMSYSLKINLLNCTQDHANTFGRGRKLVYFPFVDCNNHLHARGRQQTPSICPYPFNLKYCKAINNMNVDKQFPPNAVQNANKGLHTVNAFRESEQYINFENGVIKYAHLGSLMPNNPGPNNCEVNFIGDVDIPILIVEIANNNIKLPTYMLYDLVLEHIGIPAYVDAYHPFETLTHEEEDQEMKAKYLKYKNKYLQLKKKIELIKNNKVLN